MSVLEDFIYEEIEKSFNEIKVGERKLMKDGGDSFILYQAQKTGSKYVKTLIENGLDERTVVDSVIKFYCEGISAGYRQGIIEMATENTIKKS